MIHEIGVVDKVPTDLILLCGMFYRVILASTFVGKCHYRPPSFQYYHQHWWILLSLSCFLLDAWGCLGDKGVFLWEGGGTVTASFPPAPSCPTLRGLWFLSLLLCFLLHSSSLWWLYHSSCVLHRQLEFHGALEECVNFWYTLCVRQICPPLRQIRPREHPKSCTMNTLSLSRDCVNHDSQHHHSL